VTFGDSGEQSRQVQRVLEATPLRTLVQDGVIYTLTPSGVAAHATTRPGYPRLTFTPFT
jgi:hypothetical protein